MRILIATGLYPPDIGGPAQYAKHLYDEFTKQGHEVRVISFRLERAMPPGARHLFYFFRLASYIRKIDFILATDTFSVGLPAVLAGKLFGKKVIIRIGGDFLWESYVERHKAKITLSDFNRHMPRLSGKERIIFRLSKFTLQNASALAFNSEWQRNIFLDSYKLTPRKLFVVENFYPSTKTGSRFLSKTFLWAGRDIFLKNIPTLKRAFREAQKIQHDLTLELITDMLYEDLLKKIRDSYAVILPSLSEVHPNFIIDALSLSKPFIMTQETGIRERFEGIGLFVNPFDGQEIKEKILFLADNEHYQQYKKKVENFHFRHSWKQVADEYIEIAKKI